MSKAIRRVAFAVLCAGVPAAAFGQASPTGTFTPNHPLIATTTSGSPYADGGGAAGSAIFGRGYLSELGITATGTPFCITDALTSGPYHQLCLGANALGGGLIAYNAYKGASPLGLQLTINGTNYPFPGAGNGNVIGPTSPAPTAGNAVEWNGGTAVSDSAVPVASIVTGPTSPAAVSGNVPEWNGGTALIDSALPLTNLGIHAAAYGVSASATAAQNTTAMIAAATAAYTLGEPLNICIGGANPVTIPWNGSAFYAGMHVVACPQTTFKMQSGGRGFYTMPSPSSTVPGAGSTIPLGIGAGLNIDMNGQAGMGLLVEGFWNSSIETVLCNNVPTGTWTHDDGINHTGSYPSACLGLKGISTVSGAYYNKIKQPQMSNLGSVGTGIGIWLGTTAGQTVQKANENQIEGGAILHFAVGIYDSCDGDVTVSYTELSNNGIGRQEGGDSCSVTRPVTIRPYLENETTAGIKVTADVTGLGPILDGVASINGTTTVLDTSGAMSIAPVVNTRIAPDTVAGEYQVAFPGGGGGGGIVQDTWGDGGVFGCSALGGTLNALAATAGGSLCTFAGYGWDNVGSAPELGAKIEMDPVTNPWTSADHSTRVEVYTTPVGTATPVRRLRIGSDGALSIANAAGNFDTSPGVGGLLALGNGVIEGTFTNSGIASTAQADVVCTTAAGVFSYQVSGTGCAASALRLKNPIGTIDPETALVGIMGLPQGAPMWEYKEPGSPLQVGLYADNVCRMDRLLCALDDKGRVLNYDKNGTLAYAVAAIQALQHEIEELRGRGR